MNRRLFGRAILGLVALLQGCWDAQQFDVLRVVPGEVCLPGARTVAVGEITGPLGEAAGHMLAEGLVGLQRFDVLDWSTPFAGFGGRSGWADARGDWQTADAAFLGALGEPNLEPHYEARTALAPDGSVVATYSRTVSLRISGYFRVLDPRNGLIISSQTLTTESLGPTEYVTVVGVAETSDPTVLGQYFPPIEAGQLHLAAVQGLADAFTELVAFSYSPAAVTLYHERRDEALTRAVEGAKRGQWQDAVAAYGQATLDLEMHVPSKAYMGHHNYGVALAFSGDLARGIEELEVAQSLNNCATVRDTLRMVRSFQEESLRRQAKNQVRR